MESMTSNPNRFAAWFNEKYLGAYRRITTEDVEEMTNSRLIGRFRYYSPPQDGETIRGILQYEQLREKRSERGSAEDKLEPPKCKMCGKPLPPELESKTGRPREYCWECESFRNQERQKKSRRQRRGKCKLAFT
ncbi:hypothetical protein ACFLYR_06795 [Chloroflexota bacterium]